MAGGGSGRLTGLLGLASAAALGLVVLSLVFQRKVDPGEVGAKRVQFGPGAGIQENAYGPGRYVVLPWLHVFETFNATAQKLEMSVNPVDDHSHHAEQVRFKTADGNDIFVDATVIFRIDPERPYRIWESFGSDEREYVERRVKPQARSVIRTVLGELTTEQFYNSPVRQAKVSECVERLRKDLADSNLLLEDMLVRDFQFTPEIEAAIRKRKLADQMKLVNEAKAKAAEEHARIDQILAAGEAAARVEISRGDTEAQKIRSEADLYRREQEAQGELAVRTAEAEGQKLLNEALSGAGGPNLVGLQMARALDGIEVIVLPSGEGGLNPLDIGGMMKLYGVEDRR